MYFLQFLLMTLTFDPFEARVYRSTVLSGGIKHYGKYLCPSAETSLSNGIDILYITFTNTRHRDEYKTCDRLASSFSLH